MPSSSPELEHLLIFIFRLSFYDVVYQSVLINLLFPKSAATMITLTHIQDVTKKLILGFEPILYNHEL